MANFIFSPCGTSLLTNGATNEQRSLINRYANAQQANTLPPDDLQQLQNRITQVRDNLLAADLDTSAKMSAELNTIIKLYAGQLDRQQDQHWLLCTDTWLGYETAQLVREKLQAHKLSAQIYRQKDLQTGNLASFQLALSELVKWCEENIAPCRQQYHVIFNLTGGFKSIQGFLQTLAAFYADEAIYIFESGTELLRIPRLPISLQTESSVRENLYALRRLAHALEQHDLDGIPDIMLMTIDGQTCLSPWGELVWQQTHPALYRQQIWPSPSAKLIFSDSFMKSVEGQPPDRLYILNQRIDQLAEFLESGINPRSLDFKPLQGKIKDYTHEIDAWADRDAKRLFGRYDGDVFVLETLAKHL